MERYEGRIVSITEEPNSTIPGYLHILEMEDKRELYTYNEMAVLQPLLNQEVIVMIAGEMIGGKDVEVIREISVISKVLTLDKVDNIKLYSDSLPENESDTIFDNMEIGDIETDSILYCDMMTYETRERSTFYKLVCRDKENKIGIVRMFKPKDRRLNYNGMYVQCTIVRDEFGFRTEFILPLPAYKAYSNPEVEVAANYIYQAVKDDEELNQFVVDSKIVESMKSFTLGETVSRGYETVRVAEQLAYASETVNITRYIDVKLLKRIIIASKAYVLTDSDDNEYDRRLQSILRVSRYNLGRSKKLISILDGRGKNNYQEQDFYDKLVEAVEITLEAQKTGKYNR